MTQRGTVEVIDKGGWSRSFPLNKNIIHIGSDARNDIVIETWHGSGPGRASFAAGAVADQRPGLSAGQHGHDRGAAGAEWRTIAAATGGHRSGRWRYRASGRVDVYLSAAKVRVYRLRLPQPSSRNPCRQSRCASGGRWTGDGRSGGGPQRQSDRVESHALASPVGARAADRWGDHDQESRR